jgi:oligoendopeptidase F
MVPEEVVMDSWQTYAPRFEALLMRQLDKNSAQDWLAEWSTLYNELVEHFCSLIRARDEQSDDEAAQQAFITFVQEVIPPVQMISHQLTVKLVSSDFVPRAEQQEMLRRFQTEVALFREANIPLITEMQQLDNHYQQLLGQLSVTLEGEQLTLPEAEKLLLDADHTIREKAWRAIAQAKSGIQDDTDRIFFELLEKRRMLAKNADKHNYLVYRWQEMNRFTYTPEDARALHQAIEQEVVPLLSAWRERRRKALGLSSLRPWDTQADLEGKGPLAPFDTSDELISGVTRIFSRIDPQLGAQFASLREGGWLELEARPGKVPGQGYQMFFPLSGKPYIFWSVNGTHRDVVVLLHEGGHAFHSLHAAEHHDAFNLLPGLEMAELASQTMELWSLPYLAQSEGGFYSEDDACRARQMMLERVLNQLPDLAMGDAFQHWLYSEVPETVTVADLDAKWLELEARFNPGIDRTGLTDIIKKDWQQGHIVRSPLYMLEYAFAWLGALQLWQRARRGDASAVRDYRAALQLGATRPLDELYRTAGATLVFERNQIAQLVGELYEELVATQ